MSPKKPKYNNEMKIDMEVKKLTRQPLYLDLTPEKENMEPFLSENGPEKFSMKSNSPSSRDSMQDVPSNQKQKSEKHQQTQIIDYQDIENSDVDMKTDNFDTADVYNQRQEDPEIFSSLSPKADSCENFTDTARLMQSPKQYQNILNSGPFFSVRNILIFIFIIICAILCSKFFERYYETNYLKNSFNASIIVENLKADFKNQFPLTFRIIKSAIRNVLEGQPTAPAIILLLATNDSKTICSGFAHKLVHLLSVPKYTVSISGEDYKQRNTILAKMEIDKAISNKLKVDRLGSVLIDDLDKIPGEVAIIFHKYYDHEYAPFKKAVFVMTVNYNKAFGNVSDVKMWDKAAHDHLLSIWTDIGVDQVMPLLARLTVSVAVIKA